MKCPQCGHWNRDSLPRCFKCGCDLIPTAENTRSSWQESMRREQPQKVYIRIDDEGRSTAATDEREHLAHEMNKLQERKERGKARQRSLREEGARQGLAPSGRSVENYTSRGSFYLPKGLKQMFRSTVVSIPATSPLSVYCHIWKR